MSLKNILNKFKDMNVYRNRWIFLYAFLILSGLINNEKLAKVEKTTEIKGVGGCFWVIGMAVLCALAFFDRYLSPKLEMEINGVKVPKKAYEFMKYHAFPTREYMKEIIKKYIPINVIPVVVYLVLFIVYKQPVRVVEAIAIIVVPFIVWQIELWWFEMYITNKTDSVGMNFVEAIIALLITFGNALVFIVNIMFFMLITIICAESVLVGVQDGDAISVVIRDTDLMVMTLLFIMWFIFSIMLLSLGTDKIKVKLVQFVVVLGLVFIYLFDGATNYTKIEGDKILVVDDNKKAEYTFDDIKKCVVDINDEDVYECKITFNDGKKIIISDEGSFEYNDAWDEQFEELSDYMKWIEEKTK
ncbi:MAG: hypothetical protein E7254_11430 [Lachnospiraceae bacterium]|nr:hypothetical protein [Lachnospiraceae bacterium]